MVNIKIPEKYRPKPDDQEGARRLLIAILVVGLLGVATVKFTKILLTILVVGVIGLLLYTAFMPTRKR